MKKLALVCILLLTASAISQSQTITVTSPNGGENWILGSTQNITWRSSGVTGRVNILLFSGRQRVGLIQGDVPVSAGSFSWVVGNYQGGTAAPGTNYKVQIRKPQTEIMDSSRRPFTISAAAPPPPSLTVSSPNGGETWHTNVAHGIRWTSSGISGNVNIKLKKGGVVVTSWTAINTGTSLWFCSGVEAGTDYKIRVEDSSGSVFDESDHDFAIQMPPSPAQPPQVPAIISFKINNDAPSTFRTTVILNNSVLLGKADQYRADERNDFADRPDWLPYNSAPSYTFIDQGDGVKTVYFQIKYGNDFSGIVSDTIRYSMSKPFPERTSPTADPRIIRAAINILRTSALEETYEKKYTIELAYDFEVEDVPNADKLSIDVLAIPKSFITPAGGGDWPAEATRHHRYNEGTRSGSAIRIGGSMTIVHTGMYALTRSTVNLQWLGELIKFVINIPPDYGYRDSNAGNNQVTKEIKLSVKSAKSSKVCCDCMGPLGIDGKNWEFSLGSIASPLAWIAGSILKLNQCGQTDFSITELKCDHLPAIPGQGERLVRFTKRPSNQDRSGTVYFRCEGQGNWAPANTASNEGGPCPGAQFRWEVETHFVEPSVVN